MWTAIITLLQIPVSPVKPRSDAAMIAVRSKRQCQLVNKAHGFFRSQTMQLRWGDRLNFSKIFAVFVSVSGSLNPSIFPFTDTTKDEPRSARSGFLMISGKAFKRLLSLVPKV